MQQVKECEYCSGKFVARRRSEKYCCATCQRTAYRERVTKSPYLEQKKQEKKPDKISEINAKAREANMSWGKYKAMLYLEEQRRK